MSVDKFGRYSESGNRSGSYGKRGGLPLTSDGDYDISNKRLKFVNDPKDDNDAINLKTLKSETSTNLKLQENVYNANLHRITNLPKPEGKNDSVNKEYLLWHINQTLRFNDPSKNKDDPSKAYDAKGYRITNIAEPVDDKDTVTKQYLKSVIPEKTKDTFSFYNFVVHDIGDPKDNNDAVNLQYITNHCITHDDTSINCKDKVLTNVKEGTANSDAATIGQIIKLDHEKWDANNKIITNVKKGENDNDVATIGQVPVLQANLPNHPSILAINCKKAPLCNVGIGKGQNDALTVGEWYDKSLKKDKDKKYFYCENLRLSDIGNPEDVSDAVTLQYITNHCITHDDTSINCKDKVLTNVKQGTAKSDAATIGQTMQLNNEKWDAEKKIITKVQKGVNDTDVATIGQVPVLREKENIGWPQTAFDCKKMPLRNIGIGLDKSDALTVGEWHARGLRKDVHKHFWICENLRLTEVKDPIMLQDAVNANYFIRILSLVLFDILYADSNAKKEEKVQWMKENVYYKYFVDKETQSFRSSVFEQTDKNEPRIRLKHWDFTKDF